MSLECCDEFLDMPSYGSTVKPQLKAVTEAMPQSGSSITAVTISPLDFTGQLEAFLQPEDMSSSTEEVPQPMPWSNSGVPKVGHKARAHNYLTEVLKLADDHRSRQKRVRFADLGASPKKRIKLETRLEELVYPGSYEGSQQEDLVSDSDLLQLQMFALHSLQQDKAELIAHVKGLEDEKQRLIETNQQQADRQLIVLNESMKQRGLELKRHGAFLLALAERKTVAAGDGPEGV